MLHTFGKKAEKIFEKLLRLGTKKNTAILAKPLVDRPAGVLVAGEVREMNQKEILAVQFLGRTEVKEEGIWTQNCCIIYKHERLHSAPDVHLGIEVWSCNRVEEFFF